MRTEIRNNWGMWEKLLVKMDIRNDRAWGDHGEHQDKEKS